ncbi:MAG TPA: tetratricopeptide repeat protein, partial [Anaeromyxobacter sp.]
MGVPWSAPDRAAFAVAALFALHPLQSQAVAYVSQRAEALAGALTLASLLLLLASDERPPGRARVAWRAAGALSFVLALAAKPTAAVLPAAWLIHAAWFPAPNEEAAPPLRRAVRRLPAAVPLLLLAALGAAAGIAATSGSSHAGFGIAWLGPVRYGLTQLRVLPRYVALLLWPAGQTVDWDVRWSRSLLDPPTTLAAGIAVALAIAAAFVLERRTRAPRSRVAAAARLAAFGALWFVLVLAPTSSVVPLADLLVEHRLYLASLGIFLPAAAGAVLLLDAAPSRVRLAGALAGALALAGLGVATHARSRLWATELALWTDAAEKSPGKARVRLNLGHAYASAGRLREAAGEYRLALALAGDHSVSGREVMIDLAYVHLDLGEMGEAAPLLERAVALGASDRDVLHNLAVAWVRLGRLDDAGRLLARLLAREPGFARAHNALGLLNERRGDLAAARDAFAAA